MLSLTWINTTQDFYIQDIQEAIAVVPTSSLNMLRVVFHPQPKHSCVSFSHKDGLHGIWTRPDRATECRWQLFGRIWVGWISKVLQCFHPFWILFHMLWHLNFLKALQAARCSTKWYSKTGELSHGSLSQRNPCLRVKWETSSVL